MILSDGEIMAALQHKQIIIDPEPARKNITTSAVDLTLGPTFLKWNVDVAEGITYFVDPDLVDFHAAGRKHLIPMATGEDGSIIIKSGEFVLGMTAEYISLPESSRLAARVEGRSSLARMGLSVHLTAPTVHSGFRGKITLEITNQSGLSLKLRPGMSICQLIIEQVFGTPTTVMRGVFQDQETPIGKPKN